MSYRVLAQTQRCFTSKNYKGKVNVMLLYPRTLGGFQKTSYDHYCGLGCDSYKELT
jgi:hypothetical protein